MYRAEKEQVRYSKNQRNANRRRQRRPEDCDIIIMLAAVAITISKRAGSSQREVSASS
jgi:hypothetical protein